MGIYAILLTRMFFFQAEDGIRYLVRSRGLGDVYKRQLHRLGIRIGDEYLANEPPVVAVWGAPGLRRAGLDLSLIHI